MVITVFPLSFSLAIMGLVVAVLLLARDSPAINQQSSVYTAFATPLGVIFLLPIGYVGLLIFFPVAGDILYKLWQIYDPAGVKRHVGSFLILLITSPITAWLGIKLHTFASNRNPKLHIILLKSILLSAIVTASIFGYSFSQANVTKLRQGAESLALNEAYCIQFGDKEASSQSEFSAWEMGGKDMFSFVRDKFTGNRAILALGEPQQAKLYYWSHQKQRFQINEGSPPVFCTPRSHFINDLPKSRSPRTKSKNYTFGLAGHLLSIPYSFTPSAQGGSFPEFQIAALAPAFLPRIKRERNNPRFNREFYASLTQIAMYKKDLNKDMQSKMREAPEEVGNEHALTKYEFTYTDNNGSLRPPRYLYIATSNQGEVTTLIECQHTALPMCTNTFIQGNWTYSFRHSPADLPDWKALQTGLHRLVTSFIVKSPHDTQPH